MSLGMSLLFLSLVTTPVCIVALTWLLAAYHRRCDMHPEVFSQGKEA